MSNQRGNDGSPSARAQGEGSGARPRRLPGWAPPLLALLVLVTTGMLGYIVIEGVSALDGLYMTIVTLATISVRDIRDISPVGKVFTVALIVFGVGTAAWGARAMIEAVWFEQSPENRRRRHMRQTISELNDHYIICGYGRIGGEVARFLARRRLPFIVIENDPARIVAAEADGCLWTQGNGHDDGALRAAGVERARGLVAAAGSDGENIFVVLSARGLNPELFIVARAAHEDVVTKLERAGANRVISPYVMGGRSIAAAVAHPAVSAFLDLVTHGDRAEIELMEIAVTESSAIAGKTMVELDSYAKTGAVILAKHSADGKVEPPSRFGVGDTLVAVGTPEQLERLQAIL